MNQPLHDFWELWDATIFICYLWIASYKLLVATNKLVLGLKAELVLGMKAELVLGMKAELVLGLKAALVLGLKAELVLGTEGGVSPGD